MPRILTVSEVRKAIYLAAGGREAVGPGETSTALLGGLFHETFRLLTGPNPAANLCRPLERADREPASWELQLIEHAYLWCVGPQMVKHKADLQRPTSEVLNYWKAVENLCRWLCDVLFKQSQPAQAIEELRRFIFADHELEVQAELADPDWEDTVILQGRMDAVLRQPSTGRVCAVELKLGQTSPEADLSQACLYHLLFSKMDPTMGAKDLALWSFQPEAHERVWKAAELEEAQARLKDLVGKLAQVQDRKAPEAPVPPEPSKPVKDMARRLLATFEEFNAPIQFEGQPLMGPTFYRFLAKPARRVRADKILNMATTVWPRLRDVGVESPLQIAMERGLITIDVQRPDRQIVYWNPRLFQQPGDSTKGVSRFPVGIDVEGKWKYADLAEPEHSHFLIAGTNGSGKSVWLRMVAGSLCAFNTPESLALVLIDPKRNAFPALSSSPFLYRHRPIVFHADDILPLLDELTQEMENRYVLFEKRQVKDLKKYNEVQAEPLPRIVCICDEYADLVLADSKKGKEMERRIARIGAMGRAAGIHLLLATQRPSREVVKGVIRANMNARVAFKVNEKLESRIILEQNGAETLLGNGDLLFKDLGPAIRLQSPLISDEDLKRVARC
ncbi:MAG: FtsK/SpoIIIE domain-containing protein [Thermodesulfobacteriota bacterium]